ncbi:autotransporter outer membrane beta-barrel domain-containing protein [Pseudomonas fluorescens]|uniref:autotransporter outer membrane beta-barrel domain-containing protein n=1 Tax=Pseudomonas TaxID=286 RepID=UPI003D04640E
MKYRFNLRPIAIALGAPSLAMISLVAFEADARDLVDESWTVIPSEGAQAWSLASNSVLNVIKGTEALDINALQSTVNVNGGVTRQISAEDGSHVNLDKASVNGNGGRGGVELVNSTATITDSTVSSVNTGLQVAHEQGTPTGSTATVTGSRIIGQTLGARVTAFSTLTLSNSTVEGAGATSTGLSLFSGSASASNSTHIIGGHNGVTVKVEVPGEGSQLVLDNSSAEGKTGSAIVVDNAGATNTITDIHVINGSTLKGGNGTILEVAGAASVNMNVGSSALEGNVQVAGNSTANLNFNQASLTGDVIAEAGSTANVQLQQGSLLTGRLENVATLGIDHQSEWAMTGNSQVGDLHTEGTVRFGADNGNDYKQLDVTNLSGRGLFIMRTHFTTGETDLLKVMGTATGDHRLLITSSGVDPASGEPITVVRTQQGGDARFSLANANNEVDLGTYSYGLSKSASGNDWFLDPSKRSVSPSTQVVSALFGAPRTVLYGEEALLRTRMGEVRFNPGKSGAWSRAFGSKYNVGGAFGDSYRQTQQGFALGVDTPLGDGQWLLGVMAGYSQSNLSLNHGSSGTVDSYSLGSYLTWLSELGYYVDSTLKLNRFENKADVAMSDGTKAKGDYGNTGVSGSVEFGRNIKLKSGYFIEPFTRWSTAYIQGQDYELENGMQAKGDRTWSFVGKAGLTAGRDMPMASGGTLKPYVRAALAHEFSKSDEFKVNDNAFSRNLSGSRFEVGTGVAMKLSDRWSAHAEVEYMKGKSIEMPIGGTVGFQVKF